MIRKDLLNNNETINLNGLANGIYLIKLQIEEELFFTKIVVKQNFY